MATKQDGISLLQTLMFISMQEKLSIFLEVFLRYCKFAILGTLGMPGHTHEKQ